ncbi:MAG: hypothetical protein M0006_17735 [Magnetospirillum sp.]|nr:hypothetical protein [Magnetospirillum sp.]
MFPKLLVTSVIVAIIWFGFRYMQRLAEFRAHHQRGSRPRPSPGASGHGSDAVDLSQCPVCGTWRTVRAGGCGRPDCPQARGR